MSSHNVAGRKIRERRIAAGLSVAEAAARSGVNRATLYRIEAGDVVPQMATLRRLAKALDTSTAYLLSDAA